MDPIVLFCYKFVLCKQEALAKAISNEIGSDGEINYWIGVELGNQSYKLTVEEVNDFLLDYLK